MNKYRVDRHAYKHTDKRFVLDGLINQINLTSDTVKIEWKI